MHFFDLIANKTLTGVLSCLIMHPIGIIMHGRKTGSVTEKIDPHATKNLNPLGGLK
tara:strand:- start:4961 stop:5128 length:168 start_codon:yes stop_codon:yes gene_type:complete